MRIDISNLLKTNGNELKVDESANIADFVTLPKEVTEVSRLNLKGQLKNVSGVLTFNGEIDFAYKAVCARCLGDVKEEFSLRVEDSFFNDKLENSDDSYIYTGRELDFSKFLVDNVALAIPMKHLCNDGCVGLCTQCGCNMNHKECECQDEYIDPRFQKLKDLLK